MANSLVKYLKFKADYPSKNATGKMPILDLQVWVETYTTPTNPTNPTYTTPNHTTPTYNINQNGTTYTTPTNDLTYTTPTNQNVKPTSTTKPSEPSPKQEMAGDGGEEGWASPKYHI